MRKLHLSPSIIFKLLKSKPINASYAFCFDHKNLTLTAIKFLKNSQKIINFAGMTFYSGLYNGKEIIIASGGTYGPDTAIATEIVCFLGAKYLIRIGSCGSLIKGLRIGDIVIPDSILNESGVTKFYNGELSISKKITSAIESVIRKHRTHKGKVWSYDALFRESKELILARQKQGAIGVDMALASFIKVVSHYKRSGGACFVVSDNLISGAIGFKDFKFHKNMQYLLENVFNIVEFI